MSLLIAFQPVLFSSLLFILTAKFYEEFLISRVLSAIFLTFFILNSAIYTIGSTTIFFRRMNDIGKKKIFSLILFVLGKIPPIGFFVSFYTFYLLIKPSSLKNLDYWKIFKRIISKLICLFIYLLFNKSGLENWNQDQKLQDQKINR